MKLSGTMLLSVLAIASLDSSSAATVPTANNPYNYPTQGPTPASGNIAASPTQYLGTTAQYDNTAVPTTLAPITQSAAYLSGSPDLYPNVQCNNAGDSHLADVCYTYQLYGTDNNNVFVTFKPENASLVNYVILHYANTDGSNQISPTMTYNANTQQWESSIAVKSTQDIEFSYTFFSEPQGAQVDTETCYYESGTITCPNTLTTSTTGSFSSTPPVISNGATNTSTAPVTTAAPYYGTTTGVSVSKTQATSSALQSSVLSVSAALIGAAVVAIM